MMTVSPVYHMLAHESFSFQAEKWEQRKLRFVKFPSASALNGKPDKDQVNSVKLCFRFLSFQLLKQMIMNVICFTQH